MDILDYLTPEERAAYTAKMTRSTGDRVAAFGIGVGDAIQNFGSGRRENDFDQFQQGLKADENLARVEQMTLGEDRRNQAKEEAVRALEEKRRGGVLNTIGQNYDPDIGKDDAMKLYQIDEGNKARMLAAKTAASKPRAKEKNPFWDTVNRKFGEDYQDYFARGGYAYSKKNIDQLKDIEKEFDTTKNISGGVGLIPKPIRDLVPGTQEGAAVQDKITQTILTTLRASLGPQFTENEGTRVVEMTFNPRQSPKENRDRLYRLTNQLEKQALIKENAANYAKQHGTLEGYDGPRMAVTADDLLGGMSQSSGLSPEEQSRLDELERKHGK